MVKTQQKPLDNSQSKQVAASMRGLKAGFATILNSEAAEELAFNCAEIFVEMPEIEKRLRNIIDTGKASPDDFKHLETTLAVHWAYHISEIKRILDQVCK